MKRSKGDDGHDDQGPSHHEGETTPSEYKAAEASNPKPAPETSSQPQESKEQTAQDQTQPIQPTPTPIIDQNPLNPDTSEESSSPPQYFSQIPLIQRLEAQQNPTIAGSAELLKNTPEGLAILPKRRVVRERSLTIRTTEPSPQEVQIPQAKSLDPLDELIQEKTKTVNALLSHSERNQEIQKNIATLSTNPETFFKQIKEMFPESSTMEVDPSDVAEGSGVDKGKGVAEATEDVIQTPVLSEEEDVPEVTHAYLFAEEDNRVYLRRPNLCPDVSELIRIRFERTAQERSRVFSNIPIRRILDISTQSFAYKNILYAKYMVEREGRQIYTFTDADLINLCAYDLPHLHGYLTGRLESKRDYAIFLRRVVLVMKEQIIFNSKIDFEIGWQLGEDKIALTKSDDTHPGIEHWVTNSVVTSPVLGFVYVDNNEKKVFKVFEAAKYSNQTLTRIENTINSLKGVNSYKQSLQIR